MRYVDISGRASEPPFPATENRPRRYIWRASSTDMETTADESEDETVRVSLVERTYSDDAP